MLGEQMFGEQMFREQMFREQMFGEQMFREQMFGEQMFGEQMFWEQTLREQTFRNKRSGNKHLGNESCLKKSSEGDQKIYLHSFQDSTGARSGHSWSEPHTRMELCEALKPSASNADSKGVPSNKLPRS
jgi:hypothetical protein